MQRRTPDLCAKWMSGRDPEPIIQSYVAGVRQADRLSEDYAKMALAWAIRFDERISSRERPLIAEYALFHAWDGDDLSKKNIIKLATKFERASLRRKQQDYVLVTSINFVRPPEPYRWKIDGCFITISSDLPRRFRRKQLVEQSAPEGYPGLPDNYSWVRVRLSARSAIDAAERAIRSLTALRGMWNYIVNFQTYDSLILRKKQPFNKIVCGPIHTLHDVNGSPVEHPLWFDPHYQQPRPLFNIRKFHNQLKTDEAKLRSIIKRKPAPDGFAEVFARYAEALDRPEAETSFLRLWAVLEFIGGNQCSYDQIVKRVTYLCDNPDLAKQELTYAKDLRNSHVHHNEAIDAGGIAVYVLRVYVDILLDFVFSPPSKALTLAQSLEILDQPRDVAEINRRIDVLRRAKALQSSRVARSAP